MTRPPHDSHPLPGPVETDPGLADADPAGHPSQPGSLLSAHNLSVAFETSRGRVHAVNGVDLDVPRGEVLGVVGESGSGKSVTALALLRLLPSASHASVTGKVMFRGRDLLSLPPHDLRRIRGKDIALVFQDPMSSMNPVLSVGFQITEAVRAHDRNISRAAARKRAVDMMGLVGIPRPSTRADDYPHQFSGGMRQRAMIAMAIANSPSVLIADEVTTALDVTIQAQILNLFRKIREELGTAIVLITHDLGVVAEVADRVVVMYAGRVVERGDMHSLLSAPIHPYTRGLMSSKPRLHSTLSRLRSIPGEPPDPTSIAAGCAFQPRCFLGGDRVRCSEERPELRSLDAQRAVACHYYAELPRNLDEDPTRTSAPDHGGV